MNKRWEQIFPTEFYKCYEKKKKSPNDTCICVTESLCYTPETMTLLINYTPI